MIYLKNTWRGHFLQLITLLNVRVCIRGQEILVFRKISYILNERSLTEELQTVTTEEFTTLFPQTSHKTTK